MSINRGAVVIVKHGDQEIADAIEKGLDIRYRDEKKDENTCKTELAAIARQKDIAKKFRAARRKYRIKKKPKEQGVVKNVFIFLVYAFTMFVDKYMRIKE